MTYLAEEMDYVARRVLEVLHGKHVTTALACTSYDKKAHAVKGIALPHGLETGWIPLKATHTSKDGGTGIFVGATPGDPSTISSGFNGDVLDITFEQGDPNNGTASFRMSQPKSPPQVEAGEMLHLHEKGNSTLYKQDGSIVQTHFAKQGTFTWNADGSVTIDTKGAPMTLKTSGGDMMLNSGGGTIQMN